MTDVNAKAGKTKKRERVSDSDGRSEGRGRL